jgi:hypothetical protein
VKPAYRNTLIALVIIAAFAAGYYTGYIEAYYPATIRHSRERKELLKRISDLEEREKSRTSTTTTIEKPPR